MKTQTTLGSFIALKLTLAEQASEAANVANRPQTEMVPLQPLVRLMTRNFARTAAAEDGAGCRVYRFCSFSSSATSSFLPPSSPPTNAPECRRTHAAHSKRRAK